MADRAQIEAALVAAHNAGNEADARALAAALVGMGDKSLQSAQAPEPDRAGTPDWMKGTVWAKDSFVNERLKNERSGMSMVPRVGASILGAEGGPTGSAINTIGEKLGQFIEGDSDSGRVGQAAILGAVPLGAGAGLLNNIKNAAKIGAGAAAGEGYRAAVDGDQSNVGNAAMLGSGISLGAGALNKILGMVMQYIKPEDAAAAIAAATRNTTRDASLAGGRQLGMVVPPTAVNDTWVNRRLEGLAGGPRVGREATLKNNLQGGSAIREDMGLTRDAPLTTDVIDTLQDKAAEPYKKITNLSENGGVTMYHDGSPGSGFLTTDAAAVRAGPKQAAKVQPQNPLELDHTPTKEQVNAAFEAGHDAVIVDTGNGRIDAWVPPQPGRTVIYAGSPVATAADDLQAMKQARQDKKGYYNSPGPYDPANQIKGDAAGETESALMDRMQEAAMQSGKPELIQELVRERQKYAKLEDIRKALNPDNGEINLNKLGALSAKDRPLSGNTGKVADFANAFEGKFTRPSAAIPNPGVSALEPIAPFLGGAAAGVKGAAAATVNTLLRDPIRAGILSKTGQRLLATPNYRPRTSANPELELIMQRIAAMLAANQEKQ